MKDEGAGAWIGKLEAELARELGQPVTLVAGGDAPDPSRSFANGMEVPGARLDLAADREDTAAFLAEARVIEAGQADPATVEELWSGILASVATRLEGKACPAGTPEAAAAACVLRLGSASLRMSLGVTATACVAEKAAPERPAIAAEPRTAGDALPRTAGQATGNFDLLLEVELDASVRFGSREMELRELLELGPGDVVELDRHVADPVDLIVGDRIVARGEVVLVSGNFGLRVTEVAEPVRRLESIRCIW